MNTRLRLTILAALFAFLAPATSILQGHMIGGIDVPDGTRKCIKPKDPARPSFELFTPLSCLEPVINVSASSVVIIAAYTPGGTMCSACSCSDTKRSLFMPVN